MAEVQLAHDRVQRCAFIKRVVTFHDLNIYEFADQMSNYCLLETQQRSLER
jgi:hypothetical protein